MSFRAFILGVVASVSMTAPASALTVTAIDGVWQNATPSIQGEGTDSIRWGGNAGYGLSGYDFDAPAAQVEATADQEFVFGRFSHLNVPVYMTAGGFLESVDLAIEFSVQGVSNAISTVLSFTHLETNNRARTCAGGRAKRSGGCDDRVSAVLQNAVSDQFVVDGTTYFLEVLGFNSGNRTMAEFWTEETRNNMADLVAVFRTVDVVGPDPQSPPSEVPLPGSGLLLLGGLAGLYAKRRFA